MSNNLNANEIVTFRNTYGAVETNGLVNGPAYHKQEMGRCDWDQPGLAITRLRLLSDPGFPVWDVSYGHGVLNGERVEVNLPFTQVPKQNMKAFFIEEGKRAHVFVKGLGLLDEGVISKLM